MIANTIHMPKRFDYSASAEFNSSLADILAEHGDGVEILLDCQYLTYLDSAGLGLLVMGHKKAMAHRATTVITNVTPSVKEILLLANLQKIITIK